MLSETQKITGGIEEGGSWGQSVCFYSTGISPKTREAQEKTEKPRQRKSGRKAELRTKNTIPAPMAKQKKTIQKGCEENTTAGKGKGKGKQQAEDKGKGEGKGTSPFKKDQDCEHAGVAIAIHQKWLKNLEEVRDVSGIIIVAKLKGAAGALHL